MATQPCDGCRLLTLAGVSTRNAGVERRFLEPFDIVERLAASERPKRAGSRAWRNRLGSLLQAHGSAGTLRTAGRAKIDLLPHQLEPALAIVRGRGTRLLIADEVGLGKTVEAALVVAELLDRRAAERVLFITPPGIREQWAGELATRFNLETSILDAASVRRRVACLPVGTNPWSTVPLCIASLDYVKRPEIQRSVLACRWDIVVVDEVHRVVSGTDRWHAVSALTERAAYVVLLTATPHNGDRTAFRSLCSLGAADPAEPLLVFRRTRDEVALGVRRRVHRLTVRASDDERRMHAALHHFARAVRTEQGDRDADAWIALTVLHKRAFSSARALELSVRRRLASLESVEPDLAAQLPLPLGHVDGELDAEDDMPAWTVPALEDVERERRLLALVADLAGRAAGRETKIVRLSRLLARLSKLREPAIVFTEYRDTLLHLQQKLALPTLLLHGGLTRDERRKALDQFEAGRAPVLLTTDAAGEGVNLHRSARVVVNLELPWNPVRLEQRIGRVDRIGQSRTVHAFHLMAGSTGEASIAVRLRKRVAAAQADIGGADPFGANDARWDAETTTDDRIALVRLPDTARAERDRLAAVRRLGIGANASGAAAPAIVRVRGWRLRAALGNRWIALARSALEDAGGTPIAVHVTAMTIEVVARLPRNHAFRLAAQSLPLLNDLAADLVRADREEWLAESVDVNSAFWGARLRREQSRPNSLGGQELFQPDLFFRRPEREGAGQVTITTPPPPPSVVARVTPAGIVMLLVP
jgi:superfamily II DNA or RNA helicase